MLDREKKRKRDTEPLLPFYLLLGEIGVNLLGEAVENFIDSAALMIPKERPDFLMPRSASSG